MKPSLFVSLLLSLVLLACKPESPKSINAGKILFDTLDGRPLQIYLPAAYSETETYPVVYMHDGQNLFMDSTSYAGEWGVDEVLDSLISIEAVPPMIVVGVYNSPLRAEEYVPYNDERIMEMMQMDHWDGSRHMLFADFITFDLFSYIEKKYKAGDQKSDRALIGSSFGGVQAFWMGINYPEYFDLIGVMSPSVWVDQGAMIREVHSYDQLPDLKMWIDIGSEEYDPRCSELVQNLHQKGMAYGQKLWYYEEIGGRHHESSWRNRIAYPLLLFKGKQSSEIQSMEALKFSSMLKTTKRLDTTIYKANLNLTLRNGLNYTAMHMADYTSDKIKIDTVGHLLSSAKGSVSIEYQQSNFKLIFP